MIEKISNNFLTFLQRRCGIIYESKCRCGLNIYDIIFLKIEIFSICQCKKKYKIFIHLSIVN